MASTGEHGGAGGAGSWDGGASWDGRALDGLRLAVRRADVGAAVTLDAAVRAQRRGIDVQVTGRAGVGRSAVLAVLAAAGGVGGVGFAETDAWDVPGAADPALTGDLVVLVLCGPPRPVDLVAVRAAPARVLAVLNKADALTDPAAVAVSGGAELGLECLPVAAGVGPAGAGVDPLRAVVRGLIDEVRAERAAALLSVLRGLTGVAAVRDRVEAYLGADEGVRLGAVAAGPHPRVPQCHIGEPHGTRCDIGEPPGDPLAAAGYWRGRLQADGADEGVRAALARHRDHVRDWERWAGRV